MNEQQKIEDSRRFLKRKIYDKTVKILEKTEGHVIKLDNIHIIAYTDCYEGKNITSVELRDGRIVLRDNNGDELRLCDVCYGEEKWIFAGIFAEFEY